MHCFYHSMTGCRAIVLGAVLAWAHTSTASADGVETAGEVLRFALPVGAAGISLFKRDNDGALQLALSEGLTIGTSYVLSRLITEERPDGSGMHAFPSDSTAVAFSAAAYLERRYGWDYGLPAYAVAAFVGYSRVHADKHHWHDVAAGALIGWGASMLTTRPYMDNVQVSVSAGYESAPIGATVRAVW
jgi:membrane-associated phospholipid phosphatase